MPDHYEHGMAVQSSLALHCAALRITSMSAYAVHPPNAFIMREALAEQETARLCAHVSPEAQFNALTFGLHACSNANPGDFQGTESPPWSPRRVPPAHVWGEGPPRHPGYRSGGAILPGVPEGNAHVHHPVDLHSDVSTP